MLRFIDSRTISNKRILLRVDFNVTLNPDSTLADDLRIKQSIPTLKRLLSKHNSIILLSHLGRPKKREKKYSLAPVVKALKRELPKVPITLVDTISDIPEKHAGARITVLENIRFWEEEEKNDPAFAKALAAHADVYVNDAFGVSHRSHASVVGVAHLLPSYGGLLLKKELNIITGLMTSARHPVVAIVGGAKISTKLTVLTKLIRISDYLLIGGAMANTFLKMKGHNIGSASLYEKDEIESASEIAQLSKKYGQLLLPNDVVMGTIAGSASASEVMKVKDIKHTEKRAILDIGPETQAAFGAVIAQARTIVWNGPVGYLENPAFRRGTDFIYYSITHHPHVLSIVGGGDTLAAISNKDYLSQITHISTGGGAMLELIEKGTLVGIEALKHSKS